LPGNGLRLMSENQPQISLWTVLLRPERRTVPLTADCRPWRGRRKRCPAQQGLCWQTLLSACGYRPLCCVQKGMGWNGVGCWDGGRVTRTSGTIVLWTRHPCRYAIRPHPLPHLPPSPLPSGAQPYCMRARSTSFHEGMRYPHPRQHEVLQVTSQAYGTYSSCLQPPHVSTSRIHAKHISATWGSRRRAAASA